MRTIAQIQTNLPQIESIKSSLQAQIELLENEYQANAIESIGERCQEFDSIISKLQQAKEALNSLWHMEVDATMPD